MKRLLASRGTTAVLVAVAMLLVAGGTYALASGGGTITVCVKKHGGALYKAKKCKKGDKKLSWNKQGPQGKTGATGAPGANGAPGAPGTPGFVSMGGWSGSVGTIAPAPSPTTTQFVFAGPVTTLTTTATQSIAGSGSVALGTNSGTPLADVGVCVSPTGANTPAPLDNNTDGAFTELDITTTRQVYGESATGTPGAGTWDVGICVQNDSSTLAINNNDYSVGYAFVANGTVVSQAKKASHRP
jgi:hypothetical protein